MTGNCKLELDAIAKYYVMQDYVKFELAMKRFITSRLPDVKVVVKAADLDPYSLDVQVVSLVDEFGNTIVTVLYKTVNKIPERILHNARLDRESIVKSAAITALVFAYITKNGKMSFIQRFKTHLEKIKVGPAIISTLVGVFVGSSASQFSKIGGAITGVLTAFFTYLVYVTRAAMNVNKTIFMKLNCEVDEPVVFLDDYKKYLHILLEEFEEKQREVILVDKRSRVGDNDPFNRGTDNPYNAFSNLFRAQR